jgi:ABC-type lipoprotein export system ATPase subunit
MDLLTELNRAGSTIIMVTHEPKYAAYAHRTISMLDGVKSDERRHEPTYVAVAPGS